MHVRPFLLARKAFSEAPKQLLIFSARVTLYRMHRSIIWKGGRNHYDQPKDDTSTPAAFWNTWWYFWLLWGLGPLLAFSGWELRIPTVLKSTWLFDIKKCCPACQQAKWVNKANNKTRRTTTSRQVCLLQRLTVGKILSLPINRLWSRISHKTSKETVEKHQHYWGLETATIAHKLGKEGEYYSY